MEKKYFFMDPKGYYNLLGIQPNSSKEEVKKAYNRKQKEYHPDFGTKSKEANQIKDEKIRSQKLKELHDTSVKLNEAKSILFDDEKKKMYDSGITDDHSSFDTSSIFDIFAQFGGRSSRTRQPKKAEDTTVKVCISLKESFTGKETKFKIKKNNICITCKGKGAEDTKTCTRCNGVGKIQSEIRRGIFITIEERECDTCKGERSIPIGNTCITCKGKKYTQSENILEVKIRAGVKEGEKIVFSGMGDEKVNCKTGDIIFIVSVKDSDKNKSLFSRIGDDILAEVKVDLITVLVGGSLYFEHLDGKVLEIFVEKIRNFEDCVVLQGEGFLGEKGSRGNLYLKLNYIIPRNFDKEKLLSVIPPTLSRPGKVNGSVKGRYGAVPVQEEEEYENVGFRGVGVIVVIKSSSKISSKISSNKIVKDSSKISSNDGISKIIRY
ncbi:DnaJ-class molecular chaperone [Hamiltosporidium magnivora]|uniref:DnaJ-class molecular chaperone n=1 Tax=Hamiltosporidium magnivora TaxID=148818 RepID=A0A4Q9KZU8_9MICR|nr:DnaJ-class molecular chaperone [Hamiltosporidium magnivora]